MLAFLLVVGTVSSVSYLATEDLSHAQNEVRDLTGTQTAIEAVERVILARELALVDTLSQGTPQSHEKFRRAHQETLSSIETLMRQPRLDAQSVADVVAVQVAAHDWMTQTAEPLLARMTETVTPAARSQALAYFLTNNANRPVDSFPRENFDRLFNMVEDALNAARGKRNDAIAWLQKANMLAAILVCLAAITAYIVLYKRISSPLKRLATTMERLADDDRGARVPYQDRNDEIGAMSRSLLVFRNLAVERSVDLQVRRVLTELSQTIQQQKTLMDFANAALQGLAPKIKAGVGVFFAYEEASRSLRLYASYGYRERRHVATSYNLGEGLVGQAALERKTIILSPVPEDYLKIHSGSGEGTPASVLVVPIVLQDRLIGVMEFATYDVLDEVRQRLVDDAPTIVSLPLENLRRVLRTRELLEQSQKQTEELQAAEEELRAQQETLQATNDELERRGEQLAESRQEAITRAEELERANQYKSHFLANMSHELRTPLNSMLILAQDLADNDHGNLDEEQVEAASVIHGSGVSLLRLINDILDLSKIEAGKLEANREAVSIASYCHVLERTFRPLAEDNGLDFRISSDPALPEYLWTDGVRLEQIANNLIGNAIKFTPHGEVRVSLGLSADGKSFALQVSDTGIGIPADKLETIFRPFEQVDGSTRRQFGGTGLGLSISRQLAALLGGGLTVESAEGVGSRFCVTIPILDQDGAAPATEITPPPQRPAAKPEPAAKPAPWADPPSVLVIEDDASTQIAVSQLLHRAGIEVVSALTGENALNLVARREFGCVILDIGLPDLSGFELLERMQKLGRMPPVVIYSARDLSSDEIMRLRAYTDSIVMKGEHSQKRLQEEVEQFLRDHPAPSRPVASPVAPARAVPVNGTRIKGKLLLVDDDMRNIYALAKVLRGKGLEVVLAQDGLKALAELEAHPDVELILMDMMMPNMDGYEAMTEIRKRGGNWGKLPIIALTAKAMREDREKCLNAGATDYMTKPVDVPKLMSLLQEHLPHG
ncbi:response regulator [Paracoccus ravus]|uniref:hybrid sensor histidine kinase/response regulator n=1 Tax=Paracoccus ravus TaxID=2447760 RepID=UPI00142FB437|nr:response regulator [Paracoccus ravus]